MGDNVFGTVNDPVNLKSQMSACSMGTLNIIPGTTLSSTNVQKGVLISGTTDQYVPGVVEVTIPVRKDNSV